MEYLTLTSTMRVVIRGFVKQADADAAKFSLIRRDDQKKIIDQAAAQVKKLKDLDPLVWEVTIDADLMEKAITEDEMQCEMYVSITAGGKTWAPPAQEYVLYRNTITISAKDKDDAALAGAHCTCTINHPSDYRPKAAVAPTSADSVIDPAQSATAWEPEPRTVITGADGTVELPLAAPGELDLVWTFPYYPKDQAAWVALTGKTREVVLLERDRKAKFIWPDVSKGDAQKHYVNLTPLPLSNRGRKLVINMGIDGARMGDRIFLTVELTSRDTLNAEGEALKCDIGGELEVGNPKKTLPFTLEADGATKAVELDFKGCGGITAKLGVSMVEGSTDETVEVTSWRKVDVQTYMPVPGFFADDAIPAPLLQKVQAAYNEVFIEIDLLDPLIVTDVFSGANERGQAEIVKISRQHADDIDLPAGERQGAAALVWFKLVNPSYSTPAHWFKNRINAAGSGGYWENVYKSVPQTALHVVLAHMCYSPRSATVNLTIAAGETESATQTASLPIRVKNVDATESLVLPWDSKNPSYWEVEGEETWGEITPDFIRIDAERVKAGAFEYRVVLPAEAPGDPAALARAGKRINIFARLRAYAYGGAGEGLYPVVYVGMGPGDELKSRGAYTLIHEISHALGFAPKKGDFYYNLKGGHCAHGLKSDAEAAVRDNSGTVGSTVHQTMTTLLPTVDIPLVLATAGKFGTCVMFGQTHRQKTTDAHFDAAVKFCTKCAELMRVTPIGNKIGGGA